MYIVLAALLAFGISTLWIPAAWPVAVFESGVFVLATWAVCRIRRQPPILAYPLLPFSFAVALGLFQLLAHRTVYAFATGESVVQWLTFLCAFFVATAALREERALLHFREAMLWFGGVVALVATLQTFTGEGKIFWLFAVPYSEKAMGPILSYNHYAAFIELLLPLAIYQALRSKERPYPYAGLAAVLYASVIASSSRAGTILSTVGIVVVVALVYRRGLVAGRHAGVVLARIAALLVFFTLIVGWQAVWNRFLQPDPMAFRRELDISSVRMIGDYPWTGAGLGTWPTAYPKYAILDAGVFANQAHCDWLQWTAEGGIPFGIAMVLLFVWSLRLGFRTIWGLGIVSVFLHACVDYPFSRPALGSFFVVMLALLAARQVQASSRRASATQGLELQEHLQ
jgi:hypothetical protein